MASLATAASEKASIEAFRRDVIEASKTALVLVDFWAEWCGPCKTLTPLLEKLTAARAPRVRLVKIDVDKNQTLAAQFRIQSIPTVYAFIAGQPVDGFQGALGERELTAFIDRLLTMLPGGAGPADEEAEIKALLDATDVAMAEGAHEDAAEMLGALAQQLPDREDVAGKYALALLAGGRTEAARAALVPVKADSKDPDVVKARASLAVAAEATPVDDIAGLIALVAADPANLEQRLALAGGLLARGDRDGAADQLLAIIAADRQFQEGAAQAKLLKLFEAAGLSDPWSIKTRARLRSILFS